MSRVSSVLHTIASLHVKHGGPSRSVTSLCDALAGCNADVLLIAARDGEKSEIVSPHNPRVRQAWYDRGSIPAYWSRRRAIRGLKGNHRILHDHGLWLPTNVASAVVARRAHVPYIVSIRGMLASPAMLNSGGRKHIAWRVYQRRILDNASLLHATAETELDSIRRLGLRVPVAVIPNGVTLPELKANRGPADRRTALFLSRIHPIKGLPLLLDAWHRIAPVNWKLVIAGPSEEGHLEDLTRQVARLGLNGSVSFRGAISDAEKWGLYTSSDLFILPTHSENFGIVVAEAMAAGLPVITTIGAPWSVLSEHDCGWWTDITTDAIASALKEATSLPPEQLSEMGRRGAKYVQDNLSWDTIARQMLEVYEWVLFGGSVPSTVHVS